MRSATHVLHSVRRLLVRCLPALLLAGLLPAAAPITPALAGGGPVVNLTASAIDVTPGTAVTVTATTSIDVGPTPWWTQIYDLTTGTRVAICGSGTSCSATVSQGVPHFGRFEAYIAAQSTTPPPPSIQGSSFPEVDVAWNAIDVHLTSTASAASGGQVAVNLTATTAIDVGPTPYWIEIFNLTTGAELVACPRGTTCTATTVVNPSPNIVFQAFVMNVSSSVPSSFQGASERVAAGGKG